MATSKLLTVKEAAKRLSCSPALIYALCEKRKIRHVRIGLRRGRILIEEKDLDDFVNGAAVPPEQPGGEPPLALKHIQLN
jgi:excisionase family DNA binding protein